MEKLSIKKFLSGKSLASFLISLLILYLLFTRIDLSKTFEILKRTRIELYIMGFIAYYSSLALRGVRWKALLKNADYDVSFKSASEILVLSWFANCLAPAKLGDLYRGYLLKKNYDTSVSKAMGTVFVERALDTVSIVFLAIPAVFIAFGGRLPTNITTTLAISVVIAMLLIGFIAFTVRRDGFLSKKAPSAVKDIAARFEEGVAQSAVGRSLPGIVVLSVSLWAFEVVRLFFVTRAIGLALPLSLLLFVSLVGALVTAFPLTPAGLGAVEVAMTGIFVLAGLASELAFSAAMLDRIVTYWSFIIVGGAVYVLSGKT